MRQAGRYHVIRGLAVATVLEDLGEVVLARSGEEALRHLLKGEFAVILLDVYMPGMDGYETAQIIRGREQTKGIPIVFLSAVNKEQEHLLRGYAMGAVDYVFKPVDPIVLRSKVMGPREIGGACSDFAKESSWWRPWLWIS